MASNSRLSILRNRSDFLYIVKKGQRVYPADWLVFNFVVNPEEKMRCGWTLPRQVGPAVVRNRLKRWSRVYFRQILLTHSTLPVDVNLLFCKTSVDFYKKLDYEQFSKILDRGWEHVRSRLKKIDASGARTVPNDRNHSSRGRMPL